MKKSIKIAAMSAVLMLSLQLTKVTAQVDPNTTDVVLFCDGSAMDLGAPAAGYQWVVNYSATSTTTPGTGVALTGNTIPADDLQTGYYYVSVVGTAVGSCESEMTEIPVYVFQPLTVEFTATNDSYCIEDVASQEFEGAVTSTDTYQNFSYQWYTVTGGVETAISGATNATFEPTLVTPGTTTYRIKAGYLVDGLRYCSNTFDKEITVTAKPVKPVITVEGSTGETL